MKDDSKQLPLTFADGLAAQITAVQSSTSNKIRALEPIKLTFTDGISAQSESNQTDKNKPQLNAATISVNAEYAKHLLG